MRTPVPSLARIITTYQTGAVVAWLQHDRCGKLSNVLDALGETGFTYTDGGQWLSECHPAIRPND